MNEIELEQRIESLKACMREGADIDTACNMAGLSQATVYGWMERGKIEAERLANNPRLKPKKSEEGCVEIWNDVRALKSAADFQIIKAIRHAAIIESEWKAGAWLLERSSPERFGKQSQAPKQLDNNHLEELEG